MKVSLVCLGHLADATGAREATVELPADVRDTAALRAWLALEHPDFAQRWVRIVLNNEVTVGSRPLADGDEVAFMPPMSGG